MKINIVPYNDEWPLLFETIKKEIQNSIVDNDVIIEHIGSTSVKNLDSKPIRSYVYIKERNRYLSIILNPILKRLTIKKWAKRSPLKETHKIKNKTHS